MSPNLNTNYFSNQARGVNSLEKLQKKNFIRSSKGSGRTGGRAVLPDTDVEEEEEEEEDGKRNEEREEEEGEHAPAPALGLCSLGDLGHLCPGGP